MRRSVHRPSGAVLAVAAGLALAACQGPDVGQPCKLAWSQTWQTDGTLPPPTPETSAGDYFENGNLGCNDLVCIVSPAGNDQRYAHCADAANDICGYCSKPCVCACPVMIKRPESATAVSSAWPAKKMTDVSRMAKISARNGAATMPNSTAAMPVC